MATSFGEEAARPPDPVDAASDKGRTEGVGSEEGRTEELERGGKKKKKEKGTRREEKEKGERREEPLTFMLAMEEEGGAARVEWFEVVTPFGEESARPPDLVKTNCSEKVPAQPSVAAQQEGETEETNCPEMVPSQPSVAPQQEGETGDNDTSALSRRTRALDAHGVMRGSRHDDAPRCRTDVLATPAYTVII